MNSDRGIAVIGAGIIGVNIGLRLVKEGYKVTLIDRTTPGQGCSFGNAGLLARSSIYPLSDIKTLVGIPGMILDPSGPLSIKLSYLLRFVPWMVRFLAVGLFGDKEKLAKGLSLLTDSSVELYSQLVEEAGQPELIKKSDYLQVYRHRSNFYKSASEISLRRKFGSQIEEIGRDEILDLEPALSADYKYGFRIYDHGFTIDPEALLLAIFKLFQTYGGIFQKGCVSQLNNEPKGKLTIICEKDEFEFDQIIIAAGAYSAKLLKNINVNIPLDTERGYHITIPNSDCRLHRPVMEGEKKIFATPMRMGLRFAGTVEFAGLETPPTMKRFDIITKNAKKMVPDLDFNERSTWMGCRPTLPDSLPVIGEIKDKPNIFCAFGHQHVGLTSAPKTGKLITDLLSGRNPNDDISCYSVERFF